MPRFEYVPQIQSRTFGPGLGLFLLNFLARIVSAKYSSLSPYQYVYHPVRWIAYNQPLASYQNVNPEWKPISPDPYQRPLTTADPTNYDLVYPDYTDKTYNHIDQNSLKPESSYQFDEPIPAESKTSNHYQKRPIQRRDQHSQKQKRRRYTTTPYPDSYESYEEYDQQKRRPASNRHSSETYYDDDYYESVETTTKLSKNKRRRRPTRRTTESSGEIDATTVAPAIPITTLPPFPILHFNPNTEIVIVRQATPLTTTTEATTTTEPNTIITNTTTEGTTSTGTTSSPTHTPTQTPTNATTYGYGPSNGNENISITYSPLSGQRYHYNIPYFDWYTQDSSQNSVVKKVQDLISYNQNFKK